MDLQQIMLACEELHNADSKSSFIEHCINTVEKALSGIQFCKEIPDPDQASGHLIYGLCDDAHEMDKICIGLGREDELVVCSCAEQKHHSEEHRLILQMILPHLELAWKNWRQTRLLNRELELLRNANEATERLDAEDIRRQAAFDALTERQHDIAELIASGKDNQQISDELGIATSTVKKHLQKVFQTLEIKHRTQLASLWHKTRSGTK